GIHRLLPAHALTVSSGQVQKRRYYDIDSNKTIRYQRDEDYADHCYGLLKEAVRCSLRSCTPVGVLLSGGLDSSAILGMTQVLSRGGAMAVPNVEAYSLTFSQPDADERAYLADVVSRWSVPVQAVSYDDWTPPPLAEQVVRLRDFPDFPNLSP